MIGLGRLGLMLATSSGSGAAPAFRLLPNWAYNLSYLPARLVSYDPVTKVSVTDYSLATWEQTGTAVYVDPVGGDDTLGTGLVGAPYKTAAKANSVMASGQVMIVAAGNAGPIGAVASKNISIQGAGRNVTFFCDALTEADVVPATGWGTYDAVNGKQTLALTSGQLNGFVDTLNVDAEGTLQVSYLGANATTDLAALKALGLPVHVQAATSTIATTAGRDLNGALGTGLGTGGAGGTILAWRNTAAAPLSLTGTSIVTVKNASLVGGNKTVTTRSSPPSLATLSTLILDNVGLLGGYNDIVEALGKFCCNNVWGVGSGNSNDVFNGDGFTTLINCVGSQGSFAGGDNLATAHDGFMLAVNAKLYDAIRPIHSIADSRSVFAGLTEIATGLSTLRSGLNGYIIAGSGTSNTQINVAGYSRTGAHASVNIGGFVADLQAQGDDIAGVARLIMHDGGLTGHTTQGGVLDWSITSEPTGAYRYFNGRGNAFLTNQANLYQTQSLTTPVTTNGQTIGSIDLGGGAYLKCTNVTWSTSGNGRMVTAANSKIELAGRTDLLDRDVCIIMTLEPTSAQTGVIIMSPPNSTSQGFLDTRSGANATGNCLHFGNSPSYWVNKTSKSGAGGAIQASLFNAAAQKQFTIRCDLSWSGMLRMAFGNTAAGASGMVGYIDSIEISRYVDASTLSADQTQLAGLCGLVI